MTMTQQSLPSAALVQRADQELADLERRRSSAQELIAHAQDDLAALQVQSTKRQEAYDEVSQRLIEAREAAQQAQTYAELAQASPSEASALAKLKEARSVVTKWEKAASEAHKHVEAATSARMKHEPTLSKSIADNQALVRNLDQKALSLQAAREQAHSALGDETYKQVATQLQALQEQIASGARALIDRKLALSAAREAALVALSPWSALTQKAMQEYGAYEDPTVRVLKAFLAFLDVLVTDGAAANTRIAGYWLPAQVEIVAPLANAIMRGEFGIDKEIENRRAGAQRMLQLHLEGIYEQERGR